MINYDKLHEMWRNAHTFGSPIKYVRNVLVYKELAGLNPGRTLDVGCGSGEYSLFLADCGHIVTAFDPSAYAVDRLKENIGQLSIQASVNTLDSFTTETLFDNIISIEVMEHIRSDADFVKKLHSLIKPGGSLMISVPATQFLYSDADRISGHYRRYSYRTLLNHLKETNFALIRIQRYGFPVLFLYSIFRKFFLDRILIRFFSDSSVNRGDNKLSILAKFFPQILKIDQIDKPLWSVGYVATCCK